MATGVAKMFPDVAAVGYGTTGLRLVSAVANVVVALGTSVLNGTVEACPDIGSSVMIVYAGR